MGPRYIRNSVAKNLEKSRPLRALSDKASAEALTEVCGTGKRELNKRDAILAVKQLYLKWNELKARNCHLGTESSNAMLRALARCSQHGQYLRNAEEVWEGMAQQRIYPNAASYSSLLSFYAKDTSDEVFERMQNLWKEMREDRIKPQTVACNALILAYAKRGSKEKATMLSNAMLRDNIPRNEHTFASLLRICETGKEITAIFQQMAETRITPSTLSVNTLISSLGEKGKIKLAERTLSRFLFHGEPNIATYTSMMSAYRRCGEHENAIRLFRTIEIAVDSFAINMAISSCAELSAEVDDYFYSLGVRVYETAALAQLGTARTILAITDLYCKRGQIDKALQVYRNDSTLNNVHLSKTEHRSVLTLLVNASLAERKEISIELRDKIQEHGLTVADFMDTGPNARNA